MGGGVRWRLLGDVGFTLDGARVDLPGQRVRAVAGYLVLHAGERVSNEALVDALWGEHPPKTARNSVQRFVADLRRALGPASDRLTTTDGRYRLELTPDDHVDASELSEAVKSARDLLERGRPGEALDAITGGLDRLVGEPLGGIGDTEYGAAARHRLDDIAIDGLEVRLAAQLDLGHVSDVAAEARALIDRYPYRETLWAHLMTGLYGSGRQHEALQAFQELRGRLVDDLGVDPSPELRDLEASILAHDLDLRSSGVSAPGSTETAPAPAGTRLSTPATRFFGRDDELDQLESLLTGDDGRLVTIVGPGGSGKTRLADRIVSRIEGRFAAVITVELDGIDDPTRVIPAVAAAAGLFGAADPGDALEEHVSGRDTLLVLDNAEQLIEPVSALATRLMAVAPRIRVLVTSREALGTSPEHRVDLTGLDLEAPALRRHSPAVALFTERARRQVPRFQPDEHVELICRLVGGLPLAIELAANWTSMMTTEQIAAQLTDDVGLLVTDAPDVPERQRTMAGVLDAAWARLSPAQADLAAGLSIFVGGFDLTAAHDVCGASPLDLQQLVATSMLTWLPGGRIEMHELIRQHAAVRLEPDRRSALRDAHRTHYLGRLATGHTTLLGPDPAEFVDSLDADFDNIVAAWNSAVDAAEAGDDDARAEMVAAGETLAEFSVGTGRDVEVGELFGRAAPLGPGRFTATMIDRQIRVGWHRETPGCITDLFDLAMSLLTGDTRGEAECRVQLAHGVGRLHTEITGDTACALELTERARADADALEAAVGDRRHHALLDTTVARAAMMSGDFELALDRYHDAIRVFEQVGDHMRMSDTVATLAAAHAEQYQIWEALQADRRALELRLRRRDQRAIALALMNTAASYMLVGGWEDAEPLTLQAIETTVRLSDRSFDGYLDGQLAEIRVGQDRRPEAEALFARGIGQLRELDFGLGLRLKLPEWARFLVDDQRWLEAELVIDEARHVWNQVGGDHFLNLLDGLAARVAAGSGDTEAALMLASCAAGRVIATDGAGHPFPIRTLADAIRVFGDCGADPDQLAETRTFATALAKRVLASITDPTYRKTYLTLPEVRHIMG